MKRQANLLWVLLFAITSVSAAQLYRWVDSKGNVEWRDTPPPTAAAAKKVEQRKLGDNVISTSEVPFSVQLATKNHPVTFWASADCGNPCTIARAHLNRRGTPYSEKSPQENMEAYKKLTGGLEVPFLQVGSMRLKGYLESEYDSTLDVAGYPRTAIATKPKPVIPAPKPVAEPAKPAEGAEPPTPPPAAEPGTAAPPAAR